MSVGDRVEIYLQYSTVQYLAGTVCLLPRAAPRVIPTTGVRTDRTYVASDGGRVFPYTCYAPVLLNPLRPVARRAGCE